MHVQYYLKAKKGVVSKGAIGRELEGAGIKRGHARCSHKGVEELEVVGGEGLEGHPQHLTKLVV